MYIKSNPIRNRPMTIAVDFDGTIVTHKYPYIGHIMPEAWNTLKALKEAGHKLILWTCREGKELEEAVFFCKQYGIVFDAVNESINKYHNLGTRKVLADLYIDDKNIGGFLGWKQVYKDILSTKDK
jgi:hypothetical protein